MRSDGSRLYMRSSEQIGGFYDEKQYCCAGSTGSTSLPCFPRAAPVSPGRRSWRVRSPEIEAHGLAVSVQNDEGSDMRPESSASC